MPTGGRLTDDPHDLAVRAQSERLEPSDVSRLINCNSEKRHDKRGDNRCCASVVRLLRLPLLHGIWTDEDVLDMFDLRNIDRGIQAVLLPPFSNREPPTSRNKEPIGSFAEVESHSGRQNPGHPCDRITRQGGVAEPYAGNDQHDADAVKQDARASRASDGSCGKISSVTARPVSLPPRLEELVSDFAIRVPPSGNV